MGTEITRLEQSMQRRGLTKADLARALKETPQTINNWWSRGRVPGAKLLEVSRVLDIDAHWLQSGEKTSDVAAYVLKSAEKTLIHEFRRATDEVRHAILTLMRAANADAGPVHPPSFPSDHKDQPAESRRK